MNHELQDFVPFNGATVRPRVLNSAAHITTHIRSGSPRSPTSIRLTEVIEALDRLERPEHSGQEQFCDPLVPASTYWYLEATPELTSIIR